nr:hypothetical protein [uncultured Carboxylicivirga sp.]
MKNLVHIFTLIAIFTAFQACCNDENITKSNCDQAVVISSDEFNNAPDDILNINNISIQDDCLLINFSSSGCDGSSWIVKLIDSEAIAESFPPQRTLRLSLKNDELCDAYFSKEISFDIHSLQVEGNSIILNFKDFDQPILYEY